MRVIFRIARLELASLFFSPIAWLILLVFAVQFGLAFTGKLEIYAAQKALGYNTVNLSEYIFSHAQSPGLFLTVQSQLYLFVPLLTMGLISRELQSGSIKLLLSSPVSTAEIILGKYLGILLYGCLLFVLLLAYVLTAWTIIPKFEITWMLTALLGLFLLYAAYAAIGLFLSSLTSYQVVAAISTLVLLTFLHYIGSLWQDIDFARHIASFFSVGGKANSLIAGLVRSKDIIYFLIVIILFLGLTILKLETARSSVSNSNKILLYFSFTAICFTVGYLSSLPHLTYYADVTSQKTRTLTKTGQKIVKDLKEPLTITTYVNLLDKDYNIGSKKQRNVDLNRFEQYQRFLPDMKMDYVYYYDTVENNALFGNKINKGLTLDQVAHNVAETYSLNINSFLKPSEIKEKIDLAPEGNRMVRVLESGGKKTFLRLYNDYFKHPGEPNILASLKNLQVGPSKIAFVGGYDMRGIDNNNERGYRQSTSDITQRNALINIGFESSTLYLDQETIPNDIATLVLADPRQALSSLAEDKIINYLERGGNLLILAEPEQHQYLTNILNYLGLRFEQGAMVQDHEEIAANVVYTKLTASAAKMGETFNKGLVDSLFKAVMISPGDLIAEPKNNFNHFPILQVNEKNSWLKYKRLDSDSLRVQFNPQNGDKKTVATAAIGLTRTINAKEQKIAVLADADFISNIELGTFRKTQGNNNSQVYSGLFEWFSNSEYPIILDVIMPVDNEITIDNNSARRIKYAYVYILPLLIFIGGISVLTFRKRK